MSQRATMREYNGTGIWVLRVPKRLCQMFGDWSPCCEEVVCLSEMELNQRVSVRGITLKGFVEVPCLSLLLPLVDSFAPPYTVVLLGNLSTAPMNDDSLYQAAWDLFTHIDDF